jgi:hypothetical protein
VLYFNIDLLSTFYKVKSENNLSGCVNLFPKVYLGKSHLNVLYFNIDLLSTFYKVKSENNLSDGLLI